MEHQPRPWNEDEARDIVAGLRHMAGATLPILHALQAHFGYIDRAATPMIAEVLNLTRAEVHGVVTFYHDFRKEPAGRHLLKVCRAEACQAMGCETLVEHLCERLGVEMGGTTGDGLFTVEPVYCLGNCALSPAILVDNELHGCVTPERVDRLIDAAERQS